MSVTNRSKNRGKILDEIMTHHRERLSKVKRQVPFSDLQALVSFAPPTIDFHGALAAPGVSLIAECKKASPSKGLIVHNYDPVEIADTYRSAGAHAISVLTDERHFQGSLTHLRDVKEAIPHIPVIRKDFMFDPYQIYESRAAGADAILLIASVLEESKMKELLSIAHELNMSALVEVHTEAELEKALRINPRIVGVNNRNLQTFEVDFENTGRLRRLIPDGILAVGESGLKSVEDVHVMKRMAIDAVLVGETLVKNRNVWRITRDFILAGRVKE